MKEDLNFITSGRGRPLKAYDLIDTDKREMMTRAKSIIPTFTGLSFETIFEKLGIND